MIEYPMKLTGFDVTAENAGSSITGLRASIMV